ncbi:MAG TPA: DUF6406 domain-containing protein [Mycobacteriales bacterium]
MTAPSQERHVLHANAITNLPHHRFAVVHLLPARDSTAHGGARLFVVLGDDEWDADVYVGETFPIGEQVWRLDEVTMPDNRRFTATVTRIR